MTTCRRNPGRFQARWACADDDYTPGMFGTHRPVVDFICETHPRIVVAANWQALLGNPFPAGVA